MFVSVLSWCSRTLFLIVSKNNIPPWKASALLLAASTTMTSVIIFVYLQGCLDKLTDEVKDNLSYIMGAGIGLAVLQVSG